jgi:hypothetical protein
VTTHYYVRQSFPSLRWQVVPIDELQAELMRERGQRVFDELHRAAAVRDRLNEKRRLAGLGKYLTGLHRRQDSES